MTGLSPRNDLTDFRKKPVILRQFIGALLAEFGLLLARERLVSLVNLCVLYDFLDKRQQFLYIVPLLAEG